MVNQKLTTIEKNTIQKYSKLYNRIIRSTFLHLRKEKDNAGDSEKITTVCLSTDAANMDDYKSNFVCFKNYILFFKRI